MIECWRCGAAIDDGEYCAACILVVDAEFAEALATDPNRPLTAAQVNAMFDAIDHARAVEREAVRRRLGDRYRIG